MAEDTVKEKSSRRRKRQKSTEESENMDKSVTEAKGRVTPGRRTKQQQTEGGNFIVRAFRGIRTYVKGVRDELDKVTWPTREEMTRLSVIVVIALIASAIALGVISLAFTEMFRAGFDNQIVFAIMFVVIILGYVGITRFNRNNTSY